MNTEQHEQLSHGVANAVETDDAPPTVRIVPVPEGERTEGQSGEETIWDRDPLETGVDQGAFDGATVVKGEGGSNPHFPMDEQVPPENVLARVDEWEYEPGVGPVGHAQMADQEIADRIDLGLLEVSPDMLRQLGEHDPERDARPVDEILDVPRITVLERGAARNASIEPATAEALGYNPDGDDHLTEQLARLYPIRFHGYGEFIGEEYLDDAISALESIEGVTATASDADGDEAELVAIVDRETASLDSLNDDIVDALDDTPFEVFDDWDWVEQSQTEFLADADPEQHSDEGPDSSEGSTSPTQQPDTNMGDNDNDNDDLHEQLAEVRQRADTLEEDKDQLAEEKEDLEEQLSEMEDDLEAKDETIEQLQPIKTVLAEAAAGDSHLTAEQLADRFNASELIDSLGDDEEDDQSPVDVVREQLAADIEPRGDSAEEELENVDEEEVEQLAGSVLSVDDVQRVNSEELSKREFIKREHDVDPAEYNTEDSLRQAIAAEGGD